MYMGVCCDAALFEVRFSLAPLHYAINTTLDLFFKYSSLQVRLSQSPLSPADKKKSFHELSTTSKASPSHAGTDNTDVKDTHKGSAGIANNTMNAGDSARCSEDKSGISGTTNQVDSPQSEHGPERGKKEKDKKDGKNNKSGSSAQSLLFQPTEKNEITDGASSTINPCSIRKSSSDQNLHESPNIKKEESSPVHTKDVARA